MTTLYFAGAEIKTHLELLRECGITRYALNGSVLMRRTKKVWDASTLPEGAEWVLFTNRGEDLNLIRPLIEQKPTILVGPLSWVDDPLVADAIDTFAPLWTPDAAFEPGYTAPMVSLAEPVVKDPVQFRKALGRFPDTNVMAVTGITKGVERLDSLATTAWYSVLKSGETQVWANNRLRRYPNTQQIEARAKHLDDFAALGCNPTEIANGSSAEAARGAIKSWLAWEERHNDAPSLVLLSNMAPMQDAVMPASPVTSIANHPSVMRHVHEQQPLPVFGFDSLVSTYKDGEGRDVHEETVIVTSPNHSQRMCSTCVLANNCPAWNPGSACAFNIPLEIRTKDQLQATMRAMVEIEGQRVAFARFAEEASGEVLDVGVSMEMDRFFRLIKDMRDISDTRDVVRLEMEARGNAGMLSRIFGSGVGAAARAVTIPMSGDEVITTLDDHDT